MKNSNKIINFINKNKYPIGLLLIILATHWIWYFKFGIMTYADWRFWYEESLQEFFLPNFIWTNLLSTVFGQISSMITIYPIYVTYGFLAKIGLSYALAERIMFLFPTSLISIFSSFFLIKKILRSEKAAFIGALLYSFNTYFLKIQTVHLTIGVAYALAPLVFLAFIYLLEKKKTRNTIMFSLLFSLMGFYEMRIVYILSFVLFSYFIFHLFYQGISKKDLIIYFKLFLLSSFIIILLNFFWILSLANVSTGINTAIASSSLFGNNFLNINYALTFFYPFWSKGELFTFINQKIPWIMWLLPIFVFSSLLFYKKNKNIIFFSLVSLLGILLTKQASQPFPDLYLWLFNNFPGFNLFREASKFFILIALGYSVLFSFVFLYVSRFFKKKYITNILFFLITVILLLNSVTLITGKINKLFIAKHIPSDYLIYKDFISKQPEYFRTIHIPICSRFSFYTNNHPKISSVNVSGTIWKDFVTVYEQDGKKLPIQKKITSSLKQPFSNQLFDVSSIKYAIIPIRDVRNDDNFYVSYGEENNPNIRDWYISELDGIDWLKKIDIGAEELVVYENENYRPHIYITKEKETIYWEVPFERVDFVQKNPTEYEVNLKNIKRTTYLNFSESFHPDWKLRAGEFNWFNVLTDPLLKRSFRKDRIDYFLPDDFHFENNANLNTFKVDPDFIKENYPGSYTENSDGSINVDLTLYFKPQSYFYLGLIISSTTLIGCLIYLLYAFLKPRKEKTNLS